MELGELRRRMEGELHTDEVMRRLYATDASAYRELPLAVAIPAHNDDIKEIIAFANASKIGVIPRTAGTSLAGQVVGNGIVVDVSKTLNRILEVNVEQGYVRVEPGVIRDDLNYHLKDTGYFFAPETSTANRAMIGGMIGNNSCGANSVVYGSTREHLLEVKTILSDGTEAWFGSVDNDAFIARCNGHNTSGDLHTHIYLDTKEMLFDKKNQQSIIEGYPKEDIPRRNTGYALDMLLRQQPFQLKSDEFNFCQLLAGSEGTLAFITEAKLKLSPQPAINSNLICIHSATIDDALKANLIALKYAPTACELMDRYILEATKRNSMYEQYRFFVEGDPDAILVVELRNDDPEKLQTSTATLISELKQSGHGYSFPVVTGEDISKVWGLRKAGLGLLSNVPGDAKAAPVIEDTAVDVKDLPEYIREFNEILDKHGLYSVHYAHAGSGELHLRPILDLKTEKGIRLFRIIAEEIAALVKKYNGSLSGEHGDGRLRGEFIPFMLGEENYQLCKQVKEIWDPKGIFNPGKIVDTAPMDTHLRYTAGQKTPEIDTIFDFSSTLGIVRAAEQCNGSGDCRKSELSGGTMCPSYMATRNEKDTTRARANILREMMTKAPEDTNPWNHKEIKEVMDLCLSCKGCKSECPSNVDVGKLKAEWQHHYYQANGIPFRTRMIAGFSNAMKIAGLAPGLFNWFFASPFGTLAKKLIGFAGKRSMPKVSSQTLQSWFRSHNQELLGKPKEEVLLFIDEFTNYNDAEIGKMAVLLLNNLGYKVRYERHYESGRTYLSKGLLDKAQKLAVQNISIFSSKVSEEIPLVGIEPSAILTFRDEYPELVRGEEQERANALSRNVLTVEEFLVREWKRGRIDRDNFTSREKAIKLHGHCHQKSLGALSPTKQLLSIPENYQVKMIPSGCCGMAGSFGYESEHFEVSMKIGELVLFPTVRELEDGEIVAAPGTSCRHQIWDGTQKKAFHPVEIMYDAVKSKS